MSDIIFKNIEKFIKNYVNIILYNKKIDYHFYIKGNEFIDIEISILPEKYKKYLMNAIKTNFNVYIKDIYYADYAEYAEYDDKSFCLSIFLKDKEMLRKELRKEKIKNILEKS